MTTEEQFRQCLRLANESAKRLFDQEHDLIMAEKNDPDFWQKNTGLFGIIDKELNKTKSNMATIKTELTRDCEHQPWVSVTVVEGAKMEICFEAESGSAVCITIDSKQDADRLGDIIRNMSIDYMEG